MQILFILFCAFLWGVIFYAVSKRDPTSRRKKLLFGLFIWILYARLLAESGFLAKSDAVPPSLIFLALPLFAWFVFLIRSTWGNTLQVSLVALTAWQSFRVVVELFLNSLWQAHLVPEAMTYHGHNFDILVGITAPLMAYLILKNKVSKKIIAGWNILGIFILLNVVVTGILSAPTIYQKINLDMPNRAVVMFPYVFIIALLVPLAFSLHILSLKKLKANL